MLTLTDDEKAMLDGQHGKARQKAMDLLVRYAEALGGSGTAAILAMAALGGGAWSGAGLRNLRRRSPGPRGRCAPRWGRCAVSGDRGDQLW